MNFSVLILLVLTLIVSPKPALAMHISEGILPFWHAVFWTAVGGAFVFYAIWVMQRKTAEIPQLKPFLGMVGAGVFLVSAMPIPVPFAGTVSHPAGTGIAAILIGPAATVVITSVTLLLHALFLAHGGLSTLGADVFAMGVLGGYSGYFLYQLSRRLGFGQGVSSFLAGLIGDWGTYLGTSFILAFALSGPDHSFAALFWTVVVAFVPTQLPLGILEGVVAVTVVGFLLNRRPEMVKKLTRIVPIVLLALSVFFYASSPALAADTASGGEAWPGVDKVIVEKKAKEHGQNPSEPLIPLEGDLLLFAFLTAGGLSGFFLGYYYHKLFVCSDTALNFDQS